MVRENDIAANAYHSPPFTKFAWWHRVSEEDGKEH